MIHMKKGLYLHVNHKVGYECVVIFCLHVYPTMSDEFESKVAYTTI